MIKLYTRYRNSAGQRVRTTLNLKDIPYDYIAVDDMRTETYRRKNPQGLLPAIEIDGTIIGQSTAIVEWIEEAYPTPSIFPADPMERLAARSFSQFIACEIHPIHNHRVRNYLTSREQWSESKSMAWYTHWITEGLLTLEEILKRRSPETTFCFGDEPSIADIYLVPVVGNARWFGIPIGRFRRILNIVRSCEKVEAFRKAMPDAQPDYLGREYGHKEIIS
ncbi:MAG: maleylacetoacetate isomerase [Rhodospirillaceae bacterium]|nr:maleylacetoacetate isomerase [Rhodospirillaceae bacterium]